MAANTNFAVAVHALAALGFLDTLLTSEQLAQSINTNPVVIRRVLRHLVREGLVRSVAGKSGGFALNRPTKDINLGEIMRAIHGAAVFRVHSNEVNPMCAVSRSIKGVLGGVLDDVQGAVNTELSRTSLADIVSQMH